MSKISKYVILPLFFLLISTNNMLAAFSPSFNCTKATTEVEKLICSDDELAKLDNIKKCGIYNPVNCLQISNQVDGLTCSDAETLKLYKKMQKKYFEYCQSLSQKTDRIRLYKDQLLWMDMQESADYMTFGAYERRIFYLKEEYQKRIDCLEKELSKIKK